MCDDLAEEMRVLEAKGVRCSLVEEARWGSVTKIQLPGGGTSACTSRSIPRRWTRPERNRMANTYAANFGDVVKHAVLSR